MEVLKPAVAGTLESGDAQVMIEPNEEGIIFELESVVINQFGNQIRKVVFQTLDTLQVEHAKVTVVDKGALDCTIKARVEGAVFRANNQIDNLPWGGMIK